MAPRAATDIGEIGSSSCSALHPTQSLVRGMAASRAAGMGWRHWSQSMVTLGDGFQDEPLRIGEATVRAEHDDQNAAEIGKPRLRVSEREALLPPANRGF